MPHFRRLCAASLIALMLAGCGTDPVPTMPPDTQIPTTAPTVPTVTEPQPTEPLPTETEATQPPTEAPETSATETLPPETVPPATEPPTEPPQTQPPTTEPTTQPAPTETEPPITEPPETEPPETEPVETEPDLSGWEESDGQRYYRDKNGDLHTGFLTLDGDRYYFHPDGRMARGKVEIEGIGTRYFTSTGKEVVLVNPWNFVPEEYEATIVTVYGMKMADVCKKPLQRMLADCEAAGYNAVVVSAYRTHEYQEGLFERRIQRFIDQGLSREDAEREAAKRVAFPGTSEHELGLALDIVDESYQNLNERQETTPAQKWLMANAWRYGFILRYPNGTTEHTGIIYEPWHYRYVGKELAQELHDSGLCLEEYLEQLTETQ